MRPIGFVGLWFVGASVSCSAPGGSGQDIDGGAIAMTVKSVEIIPAQLSLKPRDPSSGASMCALFLRLDGPGNVRWTYEGDGGGGGFSAQLNDYVYRAGPNEGVFFVRATSMVDPTKYARTQITITADAGAVMNILPDTAARVVNVPPRGGLSFAATTADGRALDDVTWTVLETTDGLIGNGPHDRGSLHAPSTAGTLHLMASSASDPNFADVIIVHVSSSAFISSVLVTPSSAVVDAGTLLALRGDVFGATGAAVWSASGGSFVPDAGSPQADGGPHTFWAAPSTTGVYLITARYVAETAHATVTVR